MEHYRHGAKDVPLEANHLEIPDKVLTVEALVISEEVQNMVRNVLRKLPQRDQAILQAVFLEEMNKDQVCQKFAVERDYLRVLLHRAKEKFRSAMAT